MFEIPVGEYFEAIVNWLKSTFSAVFDLVSDILDFSITVLERTLLLDPVGVYPSVLFGLLLTVAAAFLGRRLFGRQGLVLGGVAVALLFAGFEVWRIGELNRELTTGEATAFLADFRDLRERLEREGPRDFSIAEDSLGGILDGLPAEPERGTPAFEARDAVGDALRDVRRARDGEYEQVADALEEADAAVRPVGFADSRESLDTLRADARFFRALTLIEEAERLEDDFEEAVAAAVPKPRRGFINSRAHTEVMALLGVVHGAFSDGQSPELAGLARNLRGRFRALDPERLDWCPPVLAILLLAMLAYLVAGLPVTVFTLLGFPLVWSMGLWVPTMESLALVLSATGFALLLGVPLGILTARSELADQAIRPVLDFMQTMPAFVYLIPAVIFFGLGKVPGAMATLIFAMPPAVRLTRLGIRQVPSEVVEAALAFGATDGQLLVKAQLPIAMPTILAGVNQTIMLALSMVVIGGMIGAGGLGEVVLSGITQLKLGLGFEGGIAVVILAIYLDRVTQAMGPSR